MAQGNLKGVGGGASGILSGVAAVATVVAAIMGILSQFGLITSRHPQDGGGYFDTGTTAGHQSDRGAGRGGAHGESVARRAAAPHFHERRSRAKSPPVKIASSARPAAPPPEVVLAEPTPSHLGAEDRNFPHLETPGRRTLLPPLITFNRKASLARGATREWEPAT